MEKIDDGKKKKNQSKKQVNFRPKKKKNQITSEEIKRLNEKLPQIINYNTEEINLFTALPISIKTLNGLKDNNFTVPTKVQRETLIHSLSGADVVAAAKTGSGKTLAFMIPLLEELYRNKWSMTDGLGALIITPTRELAYQIYELLKKVGKHHNFSSALVIGGKDWKYEKYSVGQCNILICTPGRLLHHISTYTDFDCSNVQVLVLDEADMCLSMGFANDMNAIFDELSKDRKTLLFSATQTRDVNDLVRAGCKAPVFCSVHENSKTSTPKSLKESYVVCEVQDKLNFLWSFLKHHQKQKSLVFLATCKQVRYVNSVFRQLRPGLSVLNIHGAMHQLRRMAVYDEFCRKQHAVLFATDVAARGLDIPLVDWVVQYDCPEDVTAYIHRAGRTARYSQPGEAILLVTPSEEVVMIDTLKKKNIPIESIAVDPRKLQNIQRSIENVLVKHNHIFQEAQRAFKSYIKNIALMGNKKVFDPSTIDTDAFAHSLGLQVTPRVRFLEKMLKKSESSLGMIDNKDDDDDDDEDFLVSNKTEDTHQEFDHNPYDTRPSDEVENNIKNKKPVTKASIAKKLLKRNLQLNSKVVFDDEGEELIDHYKQKATKSTVNRSQQIEINQTINIDELKKTMIIEDRIDKKIYAGKIKDKHRKEKAKLKEERKSRQNKNDEDDDGDEDTEEESDYDDNLQDIIDSLPDPDKVYKTNNNNESSNESEDSDSDTEGSNHSNEESACSNIESDDKEAPKISGKRLAKLKVKDAKRARLAQSNNLETLPISEQEQLALYLLQNR